MKVRRSAAPLGAPPGPWGSPFMRTWWQRVFAIAGTSHGNGRILYKWQKKTSSFLATAG